MTMLNYKPPERKTPMAWLKRCAVFVPMIAAFYCLVVWIDFLVDYYVCHPYMLHTTNPLPREVLVVRGIESVLEPLLAFPAFFIFHNDGGIEQLSFFAINALFWAISITSLWHFVEIIRSRRLR
jgi:hypothetical protein